MRIIARHHHEKDGAGQTFFVEEDQDGAIEIRVTAHLGTELSRPATSIPAEVRAWLAEVIARRPAERSVLEFSTRRLG